MFRIFTITEMNIEVIHGIVCEMREARREESFEGNKQACAGET